MGRRDRNDQQWKDTRDKVYRRDNNFCRLCKVISPQEALMLQKNANMQLNIIDPAHIIPVSEASHMCYDVDNIVCLNRYSHHMLEECKHPIYGSPISKEEEMDWWKRIVGDDLLEKLQKRKRSKS